MNTATAETKSPRHEILAVAAELGLTMEAQFVPWSQSRNKDEKHRSLNWRVTIKRQGVYAHPILTTDYSAGVAHCPAYKLSVKQVGHKNSLMRDELLEAECETGFEARRFENIGFTGKGKPILPDFANVLYSLSMDASVIDSGTYEEWARELGYDEDSRNGEAIYRQCLEIALKLRAAIGDAGLTQLREACQDY